MIFNGQFPVKVFVEKNSASVVKHGAGGRANFHKNSYFLVLWYIPI